MPLWSKICCPVDFSDISVEVLRYASALARDAGAQLTLFHAYQIPGYTLPEGLAFARPEVLREHVEQVNRNLESLAQTARDELDVLTDTATALGDAAHEICRFARSNSFDLIVMGTHGRTGLRHTLMGSVAEKVVRHAFCPVLTVRSGQLSAAPQPEASRAPS